MIRIRNTCTGLWPSPIPHFESLVATSPLSTENDITEMTRNVHQCQDVKFSPCLHIKGVAYIDVASNCLELNVLFQIIGGYILTYNCLLVKRIQDGIPKGP